MSNGWSQFGPLPSEGMGRDDPSPSCSMMLYVMVRDSVEMTERQTRINCGILPEYPS